ncbi:MAG: AcvB/VirJ family lysyl-phosphatidylglycerol hydrolase [Alphaproteobacteria bacterium]
MSRHAPWLAASAALLLAGAAAANAASPATTIATDTDLGDLRVIKPMDRAQELVFLFSDGDGWTQRMDKAADGMAAEGAAVLGVDLPAYLANLEGNTDKDCHYLVSAIERMSKQHEKAFGIVDYRWPILAGVGAGATIAYAAAAQAPDGTVAGALALDPAAAVKTRLPLCEGAPSTRTADGYSYGANPDIPGWLVVADHQKPGAMPWTDGMKTAERVTPQADEDAQALLSRMFEQKIGFAMPTTAGLGDLPLVELPAAHAPKALAVILSGDGGWRDLDMQIGQVLASRAIGVVGLDTLRYFWSAKTPTQVGSDLEKIIAHYQATWDVTNVLLVGYSFGADVLPAAINRIAPATLKDVVQISLLGLSQKVAFEFHVAGNWLGFGHADMKPIAPEARRLDLAKVQCVYGEEEEDSLCRAPLFQKAELIETRGGHHFDGDYQALARRILDGYEKRRSA